MKSSTIILLTLMVCSICKGQIIKQQQIRDARNIVSNRDVYVDSVIIAKVFNDTLEANKTEFKNYHGALIQVKDTIFVRDTFKNGWLQLMIIQKGLSVKFLPDDVLEISVVDTIPIVYDSSGLLQSDWVTDLIVMDSIDVPKKTYRKKSKTKNKLKQ